MNTTARREVTALALAALIFAVLLVPALQHARREARDGQRREALAAAKQQLEQHYNKHEMYPRTFTGDNFEYVVLEVDSRGATAWYLRTALENSAPPQAGFDPEEGHNYYFRVLRDQAQTFYDICGGTSRCGAAPIDGP